MMSAPTEFLDPAVTRYRWLILLGLITSAIMEVLDTTIINVALPQMAGNLGATSQEISWVATGYILSNVVVLPMTAFFTETFGRRVYLTGSIILFAIASFLCGISHSLVELVVWRVVQGAGGAALLSTAQATIRQIFPRREQGLVQAVFSWASSSRRPWVRRWVDGSPTTTPGTGASSSTSPSPSFRRFS